MMRFKTCYRAFLSIGLVLCAALLPAATASAQDVSATTDAASQSAAPTLKVLSWNVAGGRCDDKRSYFEFTFVVNELRRLQAVHNFDVLNLQEVYKDQAIRIASELRFDGIRPTIYFAQTVRCENGEIRGNAMLSRYKLGGRHTRGLPNSVRDTKDSPDSPTYKKNAEFRKLMAASIRVGGRLVRIYNTHLTADGCSHLRNGPREAQVKVIRSYMSNDRDDASGPWRTILTGDFNTRPNTWAYRFLAHRMKDAWAVFTHTLEDEEGCTHFLRENGGCTREACTRIDYIFYEGAIGLGSAGVLDTGQVSDHRPVVAQFSLN